MSSVETAKELLEAQGISFKILGGKLVVEDRSPQEVSADLLSSKPVLDILKSRGIKYTVSPKGEITINGKFNYKGSKLPSLGAVVCVEGELTIESDSFVSTGSLNKVKGNLILESKGLTSLGDLECVTGDVLLKGCTKLSDLGKIKKLKELRIDESCKALKSLGPHLKEVGYLMGHEHLQSLGALEKAERINCGEGELSDLGALKEVRDAMDIYDTKVSSLGNLVKVVGALDISRCPISSLGGLEYAMDVNAIGTQLVDYGKLDRMLTNSKMPKDADICISVTKVTYQDTQDSSMHALESFILDVQTYTALFKGSEEACPQMMLRHGMKDTLPWNIARAVLEGKI